MAFTDTDVCDWVGATVFSRAVALAPHLLEFTMGPAARDGDLLASARTGCARAYDVNLRYAGGKLSSLCTCADRRDCVHGAAVALAVRKCGGGGAAIAEADAVGWRERLAAWTAPMSAAPSESRVRSRFVYCLRWPRTEAGEPELQLRVRMAIDKVQALAWHLYKTEPSDPDEDRLAEIAIRQIRTHSVQFRDGESRTAASWLVVPPESVAELLTRLSLHPNVEDARRRPLVIHPALAVQLRLSQRQGPEGLALQPLLMGAGGHALPAEAALLGPLGARWAASEGEILRVAPAAERAWHDRAPLRIPAAERRDFEQYHLPGLLEAGARIDAQQPSESWPTGRPRPQLLLEEVGDDLHVRAGFVYGDARIEADGPMVLGPLVSQANGEAVQRDLAEERRWLATLQHVLPVRRLSADAALAFLHDQAPPLIAAGWEIAGREDLRWYRLSTSQPTIRLSIVSGADWFDVHNEVILGAEKVAWPALREAVRRGSRWMRLGDGAWAKLPEAWLAARQRLRERLGRDKAEGEDGAIRVACFEAPTLSELVDESGDARVDDGWLRFRERLETFGGVTPVPVPAAFHGTLRPYQQQGLDYLTFLRDHGLHGILADDMGLGKTVQAAALLAANHPNDVGPSLIVAPTSVVANWEAELQRFVPSLRVLVLHGPRRDVSAIARHDVVITSYATACRDLAFHRGLTYHTLLLDEAQAIKNARSQTARAMRRLLAHHRLCLTGTPIENDTQDLWSLFAFLMPGLLGPVDAFRTQFATPIAMGERGPREALKARVAPFILRRLKAQVAPELPPRTDITIVCDLAPAQRRAYDALLSDTRGQIQRKLRKDGLDASRLTILDALLKLRQLCCHPALLGTPETLHLSSGKLEAAVELIRELIAGGHRALLFSQFTSMLAILRERLDQLGIPYAYLDGATRDRQARVNAFNAGDTPLFLISLKAGGSGLNLTGADYVIHYDPWWNPASEDQATDRAHRIGQTRQVFNYKLVAKDTIEEKLVVLQTEKRGLVRDLLATDAAGKILTQETVEALFS